MHRSSFNDGWEVRPKADRFAEVIMPSPGWEPVTLPHDAVIGTERTRSATASTGYYPGGAWEYRKMVEPVAQWRNQCIALEFEGVYRDALVYVNDRLAGQRPSGYAAFSVPIDHLLRWDAQNEIRVEARALEDSRWYTGAGIYRNVWFLRAGRIHLASSGLRVRTPEIDDDVAVVIVDAVVENQSSTSTQAMLRVEITDAVGQTVAQGQAPVTTLPESQ